MIADDRLEEGIYFGLPAGEYHAAKALSHSGMKRLSESRLSYWHSQQPGVYEEDGDACRWGRIVHAFLLEPETFGERYAVKPKPEHYPGCFRIHDDVKAWLKAKGEKVGGTKPELIERAIAAGCDVPIFDRILEEWEAENEGRDKISDAELAKLNQLHHIIQSDEKVAAALSHGIPEVSFFMRDPDTGVMLKARMDWLKKRSTWDLKTITPRPGEPWKTAVNREIYYRGYWRQAVVYSRIREICRQRLSEGDMPVYGNAPNADWLAEFAESDHAFAFLFIQADEPFHMDLVSLKRGGNVVGDYLYWTAAEQWMSDRVAEYAECVERFGNKPWRDPVQLRSLIDDDMPQLSFAQESHA